MIWSYLPWYKWWYIEDWTTSRKNMKVTVRDEIEGTIRKRQHVWMKQKCFDFKNLSLYKLNFCLIRTKCAPQSKSSVRPAAAIYSRDKCDRSHIHVTQMFYIHVTLCFIFRGQAYGFMWEWWEVAQYSGFTDESWCNV